MAEDLWDFSLRFYADKRVQRACLALQDDHGVDVNLALCLLWHAGRGTVIDDEGVLALDAAVRPWRESVVVPLRTQRRALKSQRLFPDADEQEVFRNRVKTIELDAERLEQRVLSTTTVTASSQAEPEAAGRANLDAYRRVLQSDFTSELTDLLLERLVTLS